MYSINTLKCQFCYGNFVLTSTDQTTTLRCLMCGREVVTENLEYQRQCEQDTLLARAKPKRGRRPNLDPRSVILTDEQMDEIRRLVAAGMNQTDVADLFNTSQGNVSRIMSRKSRKPKVRA